MAEMTIGEACKNKDFCDGFNRGISIAVMSVESCYRNFNVRDEKTNKLIQAIKNAVIACIEADAAQIQL
jgi:hypothetical protein